MKNPNLDIKIRAIWCPKCKEWTGEHREECNDHDTVAYVYYEDVLEKFHKGEWEVKS